ncbi:MAG: preprotein translocase subunit SecE [Nitrospinota bacterium]|nr:preprotein translocase subunit SecE [Nitrospinota bacterium]
MSAKKGNPAERGLQFVQESKNELRKVAWPARREATAVTIVVIISVFIIGFYLATVDWVFSTLIKKLIGGFSGV